LKAANTWYSESFRAERRPDLDGSAVGCINETRVDATGVAIGDVVAQEPTRDGIVRKHLRERDPKYAIEWCQPRLRSPLIVGGKLLAKGELDEHLLAVATEEGRNTSHDECQGIEWGLHRGRDTGYSGLRFESELASATDYHAM
jgi:hypothetical protein